MVELATGSASVSLRGEAGRQAGAPEPAHLGIYRELAANHRMAGGHEVVAKRS